MDVAVVGAGRVGTAIAVLLGRTGHRVVAVSGRGDTSLRARTYLPGVPVRPDAEAASAAELVVIATPDDAIEATAASLAAAGAVGGGTWVAHVSGALGLGALATVVAAGARRLAIHPLQTFPDVESALARLPGCAIAVTADDPDGRALGERLARDLGGDPFALGDEHRALYHAAAVFASNYLVTGAAVGEWLLSAAGVERPRAVLAPLRRASLENVERLGPAALTGPAARGDAGTIRRNLEALKQDAPELIPAYVGMARAALHVADRAGRLDPDGRAAVEDVLAAWS